MDSFVRKHGSKADGFVYDIVGSTKSKPMRPKLSPASMLTLDCLVLNAGMRGVYDLTNSEQVDLAAFHLEVKVNFTSLATISITSLHFLQSKKLPTSTV